MALHIIDTQKILNTNCLNEHPDVVEKKKKWGFSCYLAINLEERI